MKKIFILGSIFLLAFTACKKDINDINKTNPNQFGDSDPKLMITGAQLANVMLNEGPLARIAGIFAGHFTGYDRQYVSYGLYNMTAGDFNDDWGGFYSDGLAQCRIIEDKAAKLKDTLLLGVAYITEAHILLTASTMWGDIPNSQACNVDAFPNPTYDKMSDVHNYVITRLKTALNYVGSGDKSYSAAYAGTFSWDQVANTLIARAYLHKGDYANAITYATNGVASGADFMANHSTESPGAWNLYYDFLDYNRPGYISCSGSFIGHLLDSGDTKYKGNTKTDERGRFAYYFVQDNYTPLDPNMNDGIFKTTSNFGLVTYAENELILAEAYSKTNDDAKALDHLNNVRTELNSKYAGSYTAYVIGDFGPGQIVKGSSASDALYKEILREKYCTLFGQTEAFADVRRSKNAIGVPPTTGTKLPGRFLYPQKEINSNSNTPKINSIFDPIELFQ